MGGPNAPRPSPTELLDGAFGRLADVKAVSELPGRDWGFAVGVLFALGATDQIDSDTIARSEARIQAETDRLHSSVGQ